MDSRVLALVFACAWACGWGCGGGAASAPRHHAGPNQDWCAEHGVPESKCLECNPELARPAPTPPPGADLVYVALRGEDVPSLEAHAAEGKVTVFDFYADWCGPCRNVDRHMFEILGRRDDVALRKLNIVAWDSPLARRWLAEVPKLPYVIVYGKDGRRVRDIAGLDLAALDAAIAEGGAN